MILIKVMLLAKVKSTIYICTYLVLYSYCTYDTFLTKAMKPCFNFKSTTKNIQCYMPANMLEADC